MRLTLALAALSVACQSDKDGGRSPIPVDERPPLHDNDGDSAAPGDSGDEGGGDEGGGDEPDPAEDCHPDVADWPTASAALEDQVVELVNRERARGADCGSYGRYAAAGPLTMEPHLRCAARYHSLWMAETGIFSHDSPGGDLGADAWSRMSNAGFTGAAVGENIAAGYGTAAAVIAGWMDSDGHCANIMSPSATLIGVGYVAGGSYGSYWTQDFGA